MKIHEIVDLERYPLTDLDAPAGHALVTSTRAQMRTLGMCELPGFLLPSAIATAARECASLAARAHASSSRATAYLTRADAGYTDPHPRNIVMDSSVRVVAYDLIPEAHVIRQVYEWQGLLPFVAAVLGLERAYRYADPFGALNVAIMAEGDALAWHFDQTDFVLSIPLVPALEGGDFEVVPLIRSRDDEHYERVMDALSQRECGVRRVPMLAGSLLLFQGRHSLHRVTPIKGGRERIVALLAYDSREGVDSTAELKLARYGRAAPARR